MSTDPDQPDSLEITGSEKPSVPVFTCIVYVCQNQDGSVAARVANLAGINCKAASERDLLAKVTREFKSRIKQFLENGDEPIPWIEPPDSARENERVRSIPIHL